MFFVTRIEAATHESVRQCREPASHPDDVRQMVADRQELESRWGASRRGAAQVHRCTRPDSLPVCAWNDSLIIPWIRVRGKIGLAPLRA